MLFAPPPWRQICSLSRSHISITQHTTSSSSWTQPWRHCNWAATLVPLTRKLQEVIGHVRRSCRHLRNQRQLDQQRAQCRAATDIIPSSFTMNNNVTPPLRRSHKTATPAAKKSMSRPKSGPTKNCDSVYVGCWMMSAKLNGGWSCDMRIISIVSVWRCLRRRWCL